MAKRRGTLREGRRLKEEALPNGNGSLEDHRGCGNLQNNGAGHFQHIITTRFLEVVV